MQSYARGWNKCAAFVPQHEVSIKLRRINFDGFVTVSCAPKADERARNPSKPITSALIRPSVDRHLSLRLHPRTYQNTITDNTDIVNGGAEKKRKIILKINKDEPSSTILSHILHISGPHVAGHR